VSVRAVIDTNVIISRFLSPNGTPALILALWEQGLFELIVTEAILAEYLRVLAYPHMQRRHGMSPDETAQVVADFRSFAVLVEPVEQVAVVADDPSDDKFHEAAIAGNCEYVVSGDPHLLRVGEYRGIQIMKPTAFLATLEHGSNGD
jgi:putative PIN family toxin of toxin-antitoxin system